MDLIISIGYSWAQNLQGFDAPDVERFMEYYQAVPNFPVVVAGTQLRVEEEVIKSSC